MQPYQAIPVPSFAGGLNLRDGPDVVEGNQAIDLLNVTFTDRGALRQRSGYDNLTSPALTNTVGSLSAYYTTNGTKQLLAGCGTRLEAVNTSGGVVASATGLTNAVWTFARYGAVNTEVAYAGNGTDTLRKWDGAAWSAPTATVDSVAGRAMPKAGCIVVDPTSNRLIATGFDTTTGGPNGATSSPSHIYRSEAGAPETWLTANGEQLRPSDGEKITAAVVWRDQVFVFKETMFFVFYGTSVQSTGGTEFNYRAISAGVGCVGRLAAWAARDAVYFVDRKGIYRTTGGEPQLVSALIDPLFTGLPSNTFYANSAINQAQTSLIAGTFHDERIYIGCPTGSSTANDTTLVFDPRYNWWSVWNIPASSLCPFRITNANELVFGYASGSKHIGRHASTYTNDDGTAITSYWREGWLDDGNAAVKTMRGMAMWGEGKVSAGVGTDFARGVNLELLNFNATSDTWGSGAPGDTWGDGTGTDLWGPDEFVKRKSVNQTRTGTFFSVRLYNATLDQTWSVHRLERYIRSTRRPAITRG